MNLSSYITILLCDTGKKVLRSTIQHCEFFDGKWTHKTNEVFNIRDDNYEFKQVSEQEFNNELNRLRDETGN